MNSSSAAVIAVNRFGLGAKPGELAHTASAPREWLFAQVAGARELPPELASLPASAAVFNTYAEARREKREATGNAPSNADVAVRVGNIIRQQIVPIYLDQVAARYRVAAASDEPLRERLVHFWTNHFAVSVDKPVVLGLAATLENEAIRPNLQRRFGDMLLAVETHPAMILYLDNQSSVGPDSKLATRLRNRDATKKLGSNENLAREILELHTLGVNGGYTQTDVSTFAQALTGWSIGTDSGRLPQGVPGEFTFRENVHQPGAKTVLGKRYSQEGFDQARAVLQTVAVHPATALHVATKLVRHFVADDPPADDVERIAKVFLHTDGDLPSVHRAVIETARVWKNAPPKFKTPHEFVVSTFRACEFVPEKPARVVGPLQQLGQRPYAPGSPAGWPDTAGQWDGPDALLKRIEWSTAVGRAAGSKVAPLTLADAALGNDLGDHTRTAIARAADAAQGITLLLVSPEFQRRA